MTLSELVKQKRKSAKLTQPELAEKTGVGLLFFRDFAVLVFYQHVK